MPQGDRNGLVNPGFKLVPRFEVVSYGETRKLILKIDVQMGTAQNPTGSFSYRYMKDGKIYTDQQLGKEVFYPIRARLADFEVLVQGEGKGYTVLYESMIGRKEIATVAKDTRTESYTAYIRELKNIYYTGTEQVELAIRNHEAAAKAKQDQAAQINKAANTVTKPAHQPGNSSTTTAASGSSQQKTKASASSDDFWSEKPKNNTQTSGADKVIPHQPHQDKYPDLVRTTDGGYYKRGSDGKFREVSEQEYAQAKQARAKAGQRPVAEPQITLEEINASVNKIVEDDRARTEAFERKFDQLADMYQRSFYHSQAISSGKKNLAELSRLSGDYNSVAELEAEFNQKYNAIRSEVNALQEARNAKVNNAIDYNFNGNSTEQAIGETAKVLGSIINSAQADKEAKAAEAALKLQRERELAAMEAAKKKARLDLRNKLVSSFPDGGTPITSHKVTAQEVYMFAYITDKESFGNEHAGVAVSNVFPIKRYSDGTYPYKSSILNKIKNNGAGQVTLVGYYTDKRKAEELRNSFMGLAQRSSLSVQQFTVKTSSTTTSTAANSDDFWETGGSSTPVKEKKPTADDDFWNN